MKADKSSIRLIPTHIMAAFGMTNMATAAIAANMKSAASAAIETISIMENIVGSSTKAIGAGILAYAGLMSIIAGSGAAGIPVPITTKVKS